MKRLLVLAALAAGSCATAKPYTTSDGRTAYLVKCNGERMDITACYEKAREACSGDYDILHRSEGQQTIDEDYSTAVRTLEVACKTSPTS